MVIWLFTLGDLTIWVDDENFAKRDTHVKIADSVCLSIAKATIEGSLVPREELEYVLEAGDFEHLGLPQNDLPIE